MESVIKQILSPANNSRLLFSGLILLFAVSTLGFLWLDQWAFLGIPFLAIGLVWGISDFRRLYLLMWAMIPFSIELDLPGGFSTDFPAEPMMWMVCILLIGYVFVHHQKLDFSFLFHPVFILLLLHFFWIIVTTILSDVPLISVKYTLAKSWYLVCFILVPLLLFRDVTDFRQWGLYVLVPIVITIVIILIRHSRDGFAFAMINQAVMPIYRNHVDYAALLGIIFPYLWILRSWFKSPGLKILLAVSIILFLAGIYFSYTRAAWLCVPLGLGVYFLIRLRLLRFLIPLSVALGLTLVGWLAFDNTYLDFAPDYEKAITHQKFDDLVSATYRMEDISTVERFYRWVAGYYMVIDKPLTGFGPASFYSLYHSYVDRHFTTYVSDNPEQSGMHNYYLMVAVEQGAIGLAIFLLLIASVLMFGEQLYSRMRDPVRKLFLMAALVSFTCNLFVLTLNDMVETDKLGGFFFISIAIVILFGITEKRTTTHE